MKSRNSLRFPTSETENLGTEGNRLTQEVLARYLETYAFLDYNLVITLEGGHFDCPVCQ